MLSGVSKYSRVPSDVPADIDDLESPGFLLKILLKEKAHEIRLMETQTVAELKTKVAQVTEVSPERQRLIYSGKTVGPDTSSLKQIGLKAGATVHLFPLREAAVTPTPPPRPAELSASAVTNPADTAGINMISVSFGGRDGAARGQAVPIAEDLGFEGITAMHFDEEIVTSARDVKLWSMVLFLLSLLSIINNVSMVLVESRLGVNWLDAIINVAETAASVVGLHVARLGIHGAASMDAQALREYVSLLVRLGAVCVALRVVWVVDMYLTITAAVATSQQEPPPESDDLAFSGGGEGAEGGTASDGSAPPIDPKMVGAVVTQACLITLLVAGAWAHCYMRASHLQSAVNAFASGEPRGGAAAASANASGGANGVRGRAREREVVAGAGASNRRPTGGSSTNSYTTISITRNPVSNRAAMCEPPSEPHCLYVSVRFGSVQFGSPPCVNKAKCSISIIPACAFPAQRQTCPNINNLITININIHASLTRTNSNRQRRSNSGRLSLLQSYCSPVAYIPSVVR